MNKILEFIEKFHMIQQGDRIVVGVSGGADSVCLLCVLQTLFKEKGVRLYAVHINHGIRGQEAARDEDFVRELCCNLGVEFHSFSYDVRKLAEEEGLSEEEAGRRARYEAFIEVCQRQNCNKIAVAHNKNDNAETVLFHLFRGSGMKGLSGMEPTRLYSSQTGEIQLIRPLLCVERKEIEYYLKSQNILFQTDSTNLTEDYTRNKIRHRILSYATEEVNSGAVGNIHESALKLKEAYEFIESQIEQRFRSLVRQETSAYVIPLREFVGEPSVIQKGILRRIMEELAGHLKDLESKHIDAVLLLMEKQVGRRIHLPYNMLAERGYEDIRIYCKQDGKNNDTALNTMEPMKLIIPGRNYIPQNRKVLETDIIKYEKNNQIPKSSCMKWFDYDKIENAVEIRNRKEGDYIQINGSGGRKKLKDYFIDHKIPKEQRNSQILIADGNHIMWIPGSGERMSEKYKVDHTTKNVLLMKMIDLEENEDDR